MGHQSGLFWSQYNAGVNETPRQIVNVFGKFYICTVAPMMMRWNISIPAVIMEKSRIGGRALGDFNSLHLLRMSSTGPSLAETRES
jgi:hypothetical protein